MSAPLWRLQRVTLARRARRDWQALKASGTLLMAAYLVVAVLVGLISLWQTYRPPLAAPDPSVLGALAAMWWLLAAFTRRPVLGLGETEGLLLRLPVAPWRVWGVPLLGRLVPQMLLGLALGVALWLWFPTWWPLALSLPLLVGGRLIAQSLGQASRVVGDRRTQVGLLALSVLPLLAGLHPAALPIASALGFMGTLLLWRRFWRGDVPPALVQQARVEALRQGARRLGLPVLDVGPDGTRPPRRWTLRLRGTGPFQASVWRSGLHVAQRPGLLLLALPVGALAVILSPTLGLDPTLARAAPYLFGQLLAPLLVVLGPMVPAALPMMGWQRRLAQVLPGAGVLGALLGTGALLAALLGWGTASLVAAALLMPAAALSLLAWLGQAGPASLSSDGMLRFAAGTAPALVTAWLGSLLGGWLAPLALLLVGGVALGWPGGG
ncbi:hypothetical protein L1280_001935 [Deinococcus sp. HSC-46F16]|uniref:hypothetical protein n=1 Tax=Deinococcus sp. HSC-46F16 TaxID=2910968 RepID=UPI0020A221B8|nr:hypothetical protein [Deinococcus sp. HSC-46F16]MCP2014783.1 hypothetical protein [Deinococcus sp. HSC-46F16]